MSSLFGQTCASEEQPPEQRLQLARGGTRTAGRRRRPRRRQDTGQGAHREDEVPLLRDRTGLHPMRCTLATLEPAFSRAAARSSGW